MDLSHRTIAVVAGDEREQEIARLAAATGATVRGFGFPWPDGGIEGVTRATSAAAALDGADYALFPIPGIAADGSLFAPESPAPVVPDRELLAQLAPGAAVIGVRGGAPALRSRRRRGHGLTAGALSGDGRAGRRRRRPGRGRGRPGRRR